MTATKPSLTLDTDNTFRGDVPTAQLTKLGKEKDPSVIAMSIKKLLTFYTQEESAIREQLCRVHNVEVTEAHLAKQAKEAQQISAETGSFPGMETLAQDIWDRVDKLSTWTADDAANLVVEIFVREQLMLTALKAYAGMKNLDIE
jgi:hypothetical protein